MAENKFSLGDYVDVKERVRLFYEAYPDGRLTTVRAWVSVDDDVPRVWVHAQAYRTVDDPLPGDGFSWMELPGKTPYTRGSELENVQTSAWGRAIGSVGIGIDGGIASADEVRGKADETGPSAVLPGEELLRPMGEVTREGAVAKGAGRHSDLEWREMPDGTHRIGFLLELGDNKPRPQVVIEGHLGAAAYAGNLIEHGMKVEVTGDAFEVTAPKRKKLYRIVATRLVTPDWVLPAPPAADLTEAEALAIAWEPGT